MRGVQGHRACRSTVPEPRRRQARSKRTARAEGSRKRRGARAEQILPWQGIRGKKRRNIATGSDRILGSRLGKLPTGRRTTDRTTTDPATAAASPAAGPASATVDDRSRAAAGYDDVDEHAGGLFPRIDRPTPVVWDGGDLPAGHREIDERRRQGWIEES